MKIFCPNFWWKIKKTIKRNMFDIFLIVLFGLVIVVVLKLILSSQSVDDNFNENVLTPIVTTFLASLTAVLGVRLTVNHTRRENEEIQRLQNKPYIALDEDKNVNIVKKKIVLDYIDYEDEFFLKKDIKNNLEQNAYFCSFKPFKIYVANHAEGVFDAIIISGNKRIKQIFLKTPIFLKRSTTYELDFSNYYFVQHEFNKSISMKLCVVDLNDRDYYFDVYTDEAIVKKNSDFNELEYEAQYITGRHFSYNKIIQKEIAISEEWEDKILVQKVREKMQEKVKYQEGDS